MASERKPLFFFDGRLLNVDKTPEQQELMNELIGASEALAVVRRLAADGWYESKELAEQEVREAEADVSGSARADRSR